MSDDRINQMIRNWWQELGFYYDQDETKWIIAGSKSGILKFADILYEYSQNEENNWISEHDHLGPYSYLTIITWDKPIINKKAIYGRLVDFLNLSAMIKERVSCSQTQFTIDKEYAEENEIVLYFEVKEDGFDPASADPELK